MREIKFRGKRVDNGEWVYGSLIGSDVIVGDIIEFTEEYFNCEYWWRVKPETVGQYTDLKDKNGREIYEGDILEEGPGYYFEVVWSNEWAKFKLQWRTKGYQYPEWNRGVEMAVIGNIHDNPELLGVTE